MKCTTAIAATMLFLCCRLTGAQTTSSTAQTAIAPANLPAAGDGLKDLDTMTFACPRAALDAAAREAARVQSLGTYQFSYFSIINASHHALFEVHFQSNYEGEKDLKYCVALYCQQGWDPAQSPTVSLLAPAPHSTAIPPHLQSCSEPHHANHVKVRKRPQSSGALH